MIIEFFLLLLCCECTKIKRNKHMKKKINVLLGICALLLLFICWRSIQDDQDFNATVEAREAVVKERLLQIRDAEEAYKQQSEEGEYCADWDVLINFIKTGKLPLVLKEGVLSDAQMEKGLTWISLFIALLPMLGFMGTVIGLAFGLGLVALMRRVKLGNEALYPVMVLTACIFIFSITYYLQGNTYLAVYVGGLVIGNNKFTRKRQTKSFFNGLTWLSQLMMFLMLGLMVEPKELLDYHVWLPCLIISIVMIFISRPLAVWLCMLPFPQYHQRDKILLSWVGLKGAVPIIFAVMCKASGVPYADLLFNVVFLCTLISLLVQGTTITLVAKKLKLDTPPEEQRTLEHFDMDLPDEIQSSAREVEVTEKLLDKGNTLRDISIPPRTLIIMVRRGEDFFIPTGASRLEVGDQLLVIRDKDAEASYKQMTNEAEEEALWRAEMREKARTRWIRATQWMRKK